MPRIYRVTTGPDGWSEWFAPHMVNYRMACCDCGLVHTLEFKVIKVKSSPGAVFVSGPEAKGHRVLFRARRNKRSTTMHRKSLKKRR